ncbi:MFS transporter [Rhizobium pisi]|uniref:MFS transporter n=2 Tax=Rhizobium pisi TaxID=574561 RepID=A0A3R9AA03_9HYPH|nr:MULTISPECIES: MFS transporter [Rhizobium]NKL38753.1 MFS transporter [Rhizobium leguminosarum bv. viciae]RSB64738.1 MFS transporter [Rhizobium pisi]TBF23132.1 MFS transporter [Rhizobium ruizarguesonis]TAX05972.1 MFS transporter [Rhizobium leguminosarum]TCA47931.1 MFS transporter [Rhizobium pisi]
MPAYFLALGTFAIGTEGFMIAPLLPTIASDLGMSLSATAMLVVVFTITLAISSPITTVITGRLNRRDTLLVAMTIFAVGNFVAAFSATFSTLLVARLLMAVAAGLYVPSANALAGTIAGPARRGRALAIVSGGMTIAIALGLPLGALVGHAFGWRTTFLAVAVMGLVAIVGIIVGIVRTAGEGMSVASLSERVGVIRQAPILKLLAVTLFWSIGAYTAYPYIAPYLTTVLGFGTSGIGATVSMWGFAAAVGVTTGGGLNDRFGSGRVVTASLILLGCSFTVLATVTVLGPAAALVPALVAIGVWGFSVWSFFPAQMARLIAASSPSQASVSLSLNTSTMYLGFSIGSALGAGIIGLDAVWAIGVAAAVAEAISLALNYLFARK